MIDAACDKLRREGATIMDTMLIQVAIAAMWGAVLALQTRRLFRLAHADVGSGTLEQHIRRRMHPLAVHRT